MMSPAVTSSSSTMFAIISLRSSSMTSSSASSTIDRRSSSVTAASADRPNTRNTSFAGMHSTRPSAASGAEGCAGFVRPTANNTGAARHIAAHAAMLHSPSACTALHTNTPVTTPHKAHTPALRSENPSRPAGSSSLCSLPALTLPALHARTRHTRALAPASSLRPSGSNIADPNSFYCLNPFDRHAPSARARTAHVRGARAPAHSTPRPMLLLYSISPGVSMRAPPPLRKAEQDFTRT